MSDCDAKKNREIYDHADDEIWRRAVYLPVHEGRHFANIGGRGFLDYIGMEARLGPRSEVLDLCCGSGAAACYIAERFGSAVTGLDLNESQIERAKLRAQGLSRLHFLQADACAWKPDKPYDLVFVLDSLTLIEDLPALFGTSHSALRPGGVLAVAEVVAGDALSDEMRAFALSEDGAVTLISANQIGETIEDAGFGDVEITNLSEEAVRVFSIIRESVWHNCDGYDVPAYKINEWKLLSERYLAAFRSGELGYVRICAKSK